MIRISQGPNGQALHAVVIVAFDLVNGRVHGTFVYGSHGTPDRVGVERERDRFLAELRGHHSGVELDTVDLPLRVACPSHRPAAASYWPRSPPSLD